MPFFRLTNLDKRFVWGYDVCMTPQKKHYEANKQYYIDKARRNNELVRDKIRAAKDKPCLDCGIKYPYFVMDFDHRPEEEKSFDVANSQMKKGWSKIEAEIAKCDVVCSNCHRLRTHSRLSAPVIAQASNL